MITNPHRFTAPVTPRELKTTTNLKPTRFKLNKISRVFLPVDTADRVDSSRTTMADTTVSVWNLLLSMRYTGCTWSVKPWQILISITLCSTVVKYNNGKWQSCYIWTWISSTNSKLKLTVRILNNLSSKHHITVILYQYYH